MRISHDPLLLRAGVERQLEDCRALVARCFPDQHTRIYEDNDVSAWSGAARAAYATLLLDIAARRVSALCAYDLDRLFRHPRDLEAFLDLCASVGLRDVITCAGDIDLSSGDGQLHARILGAVAKKESDDKSRRVSRASQARIAAGLYPGGPAPFGYEVDRNQPGWLKPVSGASRSLSWAIDRVNGGASLSSILRAMPDPKPRSLPGLRKILTSPTIVGLTRDMTPAVWPALVDVDAWKRARLILRSRLLGPRAATPRAHWLSGILHCPACDRAIVAKQPRPGLVRYVCLGCWRGIHASMAEQWVAEMLFAVVVVRHIPAIDTTADDRRELEARLALLADDYAGGDISREEWQVARRRVRRQLDALPMPLPSVDIPGDLADIWQTIDAARKYAIASQLLHRVDLGPAIDKGGFDPARLHPVWRA